MGPGRSRTMRRTARRNEEAVSLSLYLDSTPPSSALNASRSLYRKTTAITQRAGTAFGFTVERTRELEVAEIQYSTGRGRTTYVFGQPIGFAQPGESSFRIGRSTNSATRRRLIEPASDRRCAAGDSWAFGRALQRSDPALVNHRVQRFRGSLEGPTVVRIGPTSLGWAHGRGHGLRRFLFRVLLMRSGLTSVRLSGAWTSPAIPAWTRMGGSGGRLCRQRYNWPWARPRWFLGRRRSFLPSRPTTPGAADDLALSGMGRGRALPGFHDGR